MDNLEPITRNEMFLNGDDLEPITREEMILAGADLDPITRHEWFLKKYRGGGGGGEYDLVNIPNLPADIASFNDGTDLPMASLKVSVTPYQDLSHGDPSPDNICPIIGWDEAVVTVADDAENPTTSHEYTIDLDGTRYGGTLDATNGTMDDTLDYIASYNGETLPSTWISDRDVYAEGTTPTIGAEVVYTRATPITVQLAPTPVKSLEGVNKIYANCGQITEAKYFKKA